MPGKRRAEVTRADRPTRPSNPDQFGPGGRLAFRPATAPNRLLLLRPAGRLLYYSAVDKRQGKQQVQPLDHCSGCPRCRHVASVFQRSRKTANIHTNSGVIWGIQVQDLYQSWRDCRMVCLTCQFPRLGNSFVVREMAFGTREPFSYLQCDNCQSVQIQEIPQPDVLARHYPANYYSFADSDDSDAHGSSLKKALLVYRTRHGMGLDNLIGWILSIFKPGLAISAVLKAAHVKIDHDILDVGCGSTATYLNLLAACGFVNLLGVDPFINGDISRENGVRILRRYIHEVDQMFDLIMFNHSLEHVADPHASLRVARAKLKSGGICLVRIPTVSSTAWKIYGADWVQLDAPRHLFIPSREGMKALALSCGFVVDQVLDDSSAFQFVASELYRKDIPHNEQNPQQYFSVAQLKKFRAQARDANAKHLGDQAAFVLKPV
jgi:SAM-dependent methyltransferase